MCIFPNNRCTSARTKTSVLRSLYKCVANYMTDYSIQVRTQKYGLRRTNCMQHNERACEFYSPQTIEYSTYAKRNNGRLEMSTELSIDICCRQPESEPVATGRRPLFDSCAARVRCALTSGMPSLIQPVAELSHLFAVFPQSFSPKSF